MQDINQLLQENPELNEYIEQINKLNHNLIYIRVDEFIERDKLYF